MASSEPPPRFYHFSGATQKNLMVYGGSVVGDDKNTEVFLFDVSCESWSMKNSTGQHPPSGLHDGASTWFTNNVFIFGGRVGSAYNGSIYMYDVHRQWSVLSSVGKDAPQGKAGCGMLHHEEKLYIFGGYRREHNNPTPGAVYEEDWDGDIMNNEFHVFNCIEGTWSSPTVTGTRPPPCSNFTLTMVEEDKAILFGGYRSGRQYYNHVYIFDFQRMHWSKLDDDKGDPWPEERGDHAAVCLGFGGDHPQLLVTGGLKFVALKDSWLLDIQTLRWKKHTCGEALCSSC